VRTFCSVLIYAALLISVSPVTANADGPEVVVGKIFNPMIPQHNGIVGQIIAGTTSCNTGTTVIDWYRLPSTKHPIITLNLYRLASGRFEQIGQAWVKHAFEALQEDACHLGCKPVTDGRNLGTGLGVGCSDPYGQNIFTDGNLGKRSEISAVTGSFDPTQVTDTILSTPKAPFERGLIVQLADLALPNARYFLEAQYIAADVAKAGNGTKGVSYKEVKIIPQNGTYALSTIGGDDPVIGKPAISAWSGPDTKVATIDEVENQTSGVGIKSRIVVESNEDTNTHQFVYAVYNMNSDQGIRSFTVSLGGAKPIPDSIGSNAPISHGESWSNEAWVVKVEADKITWSTKTFDEDNNANAIRWGSMRTFWFKSDQPPSRTVTIGRFSPGSASAAKTIDLQSP
jgi:hypothetical protein